MKFYSGFSLKNESYLFQSYLRESEYTISGFSYGSIKALDTVVEALQKGQRVDTLQLLSPAFFQTKDIKFKRLQLLSYKKNQEQYMKQFLSGCFYPYKSKTVESSSTSSRELNELLEYEWSYETLKEIAQKGVKIEVYLGGLDSIIDVEGAREFFLNVATVTYIKKANHFLQVN
jgi:hypothetical protein